MEKEIDFRNFGKAGASKGILKDLKQLQKEPEKPKKKAGRKRKDESEKMVKLAIYITQDELDYLKDKNKKEMAVLQLSPFVRYKMQEAGLISDNSKTL